MQNHIEHFKVYFTYCNGYSLAAKLLVETLRNNQALTDFLANLRRANVLRGMNLDDFLVKPVQRLPKYVLLLKDLLKHTDQAHPDRSNIKNTLDGFLWVNEENNKNMDRFMNRLRVQEIATLFKLDLLQEEDRLFRFEETYNAIWNQQEIPVLIYAFTDTLLVARRDDSGKANLLKKIMLNS